ncbi:MAG: transcription antitermination factor NusB [Alcanivoracaceae bacterium]
MTDLPAAPSTPAARRKARRFALQAVYQWQLSKNDVVDIEQQFLTDNDMKKVDRQYFHELLHGVPARLPELDAALQPALDRPLIEVSQVEKAILRISAFELLARPDVPWRVIINEGIELAKVFGADDSFKYVNGVLDKVARRLRTEEVRGF